MRLDDVKMPTMVRMKSGSGRKNKRPRMMVYVEGMRVKPRSVQRMR